MYSKQVFDQDCRACKRLDGFLCQIKEKYPDYYARPVSPFGDEQAKLLIVGLAPGKHGANATGRPFTGDDSGILLYQTLYDYGFSNQPYSRSIDDGLVLISSRITNAVKCLPPQNKPTSKEVNDCNHFLAAEIKTLSDKAVIMVLGNVAHKAVLKAYGLKLNAKKFGHNKVYPLPDDKVLVSSYHCSRYNIQTKRLTAEMFVEVFGTVVGLMN